MLQRLSRGTVAYLAVLYQKHRINPPKSIVTHWEAKSCSCVIFATGRLPCDHLVNKAIRLGEDPTTLVTSRWNICAGHATAIPNLPPKRLSFDQPCEEVPANLRELLGLIEETLANVLRAGGCTTPETKRNVDQTVKWARNLANSCLQTPEQEAPAIAFPTMRANPTAARRKQPGPHGKGWVVKVTAVCGIKIRTSDDFVACYGSCGRRYYADCTPQQGTSAPFKCTDCSKLIK